MRKKRNRRRVVGLVGAVVLVVIGVGVFSGEKAVEVDEAYNAVTEIKVLTPTEMPLSSTETPIEIVEPSAEPVVGDRDPDNYTYPYNTVSADWGAEVYEQGYRYYEIPEEYRNSGGCFPEVVQVYLWSLCREREIDYYMVVAMIERESCYKYDAVGDGGVSIGYLQIGEKWHKDRMEAEEVSDLKDPYGNIRVGLNFLQELSSRYADSGMNCVLMAYNMGESGAKKCWNNGTYSTEYSRGILARAEEIRQEVEKG
ncbi:transglycosylase SLT domain-containing protein [Hominenteromicrobium sp.]|jgi:hypothetical protein|uniref:transglycosylase SLT domain-containing protein n=1 Tax=Hominenteromicrobium sp. TaxID=3073581 RepID=UPI00206697B3|nr:MAG TPA: hypothetical protein [Caudoviricetes sp.]